MRTASVSDIDELPGTKDYSQINKNFADKLLEKVVDWMCDFIKKFEEFEVPPISVSKEKALKELGK